MTDSVYRLDLNPEPWAIGPLGVNRKAGLRPFVGQNQQLKAFQEAVKEEFVHKYGQPLLLTPGTPVILDVWFWRQIISYTTPQAARARKHEADRTNLVKSFEDALQGLFYENDKDVIGGDSWIVKQGPDVTPCIIFRVTSLRTTSRQILPPEVMDEWVAQEEPDNSNAWG